MTKNTNLYRDVELLINFVKGGLTKEEQQYIISQIQNDEILKGIIDGIKLDLKNKFNKKTFNNFLCNSRNYFIKNIIEVKEIIPFSLKNKKFCFLMNQFFDSLRKLKNNTHLHVFIENDVDDYICLLEKIDKIDSYDKIHLKKELKTHYFFKELYGNKFSAYNLFIEIIFYNQSYTYDMQRFSNSLKNIELLYSESMYKECFILIKKIQKQAIYFEVNNILLASINWEIKLLSSLNYSTQEEHTQELRDKVKQVEKILLKENSLKDLITHAHIYYNNTSYDFPNPIPSLSLQLHTDSLTSEEHSFLSLIHTNEILAIQAQYHSQFKKAIAAYEEILILWKSHPEKVQIFRDAHLRTITGYIHCSLNKQNNINYDALLNELKIFPIKSLQEENKLHLLTDTLEFIIQVSKKNLELCTVIWMNLSESMNKHKNLMQADWLIMVQYHICIFHFLKEDYQETRYWVQQINSSPLIKHSPKIQNYCKLIDLISLYELQKYDTLEYDIRKTYRYLREKRQIREIERTVLNCVQKLLNTTHIHEQSKIFTHLHQSLQFLEQKNIFQLVGPNLIFQWVIDKLPEKDDKKLN